MLRTSLTGTSKNSPLSVDVAEEDRVGVGGSGLIKKEARLCYLLNDLRAL